MRLLDIQKDERIADLFCGLGNFSLPIARLAREVVGIEGSDILTRRAQENAMLNGLEEKTRFVTSNLFDMTSNLCNSRMVLRGMMTSFLENS